MPLPHMLKIKKNVNIEKMKKPKHSELYICIYKICIYITYMYVCI